MTSSSPTAAPIRARRRAIASAAVVVAALVAVTGCSAGAGATTAVSDVKTQTIDDYFGSVDVPVEPQRVVAGDPVSLAIMLSLGVKPVAASFSPTSLPSHLADKAEGIENIAGEGGGFDPNLEAALAEKPDLIVLDTGYTGEGDKAWNKKTYDLATASGVPTFGYAFDDGVSFDDLKHGVTEVASVLGKKEAGEKLISGLEQRMTDLAARVKSAGLSDKPVSAVRLSDGGNYSIRVGTSESIAFRALGIAQPEGQQDPSLFRIELTAENLNELAKADTLFVYVDDNSPAEKEKFTSSPLWPTLPAVQANRVHWVSSGVWNSSDPVGLDKILDDIEKDFIEPAEQQG
ncbi:iron-siderophore ABC transporter substrate-binding protein [Agreia bicolorata]|uniref:Fe/B12 periplasmic-binding domain-containing protein n=1 Tax=Agreia bicolorata TaxID=110935 RepID=A0ABR5CBM6_9MICO|nr:iron-siderophore ABC transporter substrate-binding protein [Agreia bicolorata]KJC63038.1 hypothetical protein TZ00_16765 [Agreia bicolorata]